MPPKSCDQWQRAQASGLLGGLQPGWRLVPKFRRDRCASHFHKLRSKIQDTDRESTSATRLLTSVILAL
jgi:hypothetical protein